MVQSCRCPHLRGVTSNIYIVNPQKDTKDRKVKSHSVFNMFNYMFFLGGCYTPIPSGPREQSLQPADCQLRDAGATPRMRGHVFLIAWMRKGQRATFIIQSHVVFYKCSPVLVPKSCDCRIFPILWALKGTSNRCPRYPIGPTTWIPRGI